MRSTVISQHEIAPECVHAKEWECRSDLLRISVRTNPTASQRSVFCSRAFCYRLYLMRFHLYCSVMRQDKIIQRGLVCKWTTAIYVQLWDCTRAGRAHYMIWDYHNSLDEVIYSPQKNIDFILVCGRLLVIKDFQTPQPSILKNFITYNVPKRFISNVICDCSDSLRT